MSYAKIVLLVQDNIRMILTNLNHMRMMKKVGRPMVPNSEMLRLLSFT